MGDFHPGFVQSTGEGAPNILSSPYGGGEPDGTAFHSQFEYFSHPQQQAGQHGRPYASQPFDMSGLIGALPQSSMPSMNPQAHFSHIDAPGVLSPASVYQMQQASQYGPRRGSQYDAANAHQQQYMAAQYGSMPHQNHMGPRQPMHLQTHGHYNQLDPYQYGMSPVHSQLDPRFTNGGQYGMMPNMQSDYSQSPRRASEPMLVPSFPRGPPRKPKQSGHALWVGNLPPSANVGDLKDHFSRDATKDIESLFLISKSNCAFVNYRSEAACQAAVNRFHDSRFQGVRLVCRLRKGAVAGSTSSSTALDASGPPSSAESSSDSPAIPEEPTSPTIVGSTDVTTPTPQASSSSGAVELAQRVPEKFFVVKSLTVQDLEASVHNGIWATQSHNEDILNRAFEEAENVYLIFSANKSGEYFGYARMASTISGEPVNLSASAAREETRSTGAPQSIPTPATEFAPRGRIIDDSARGTIFWEAEHSEEDEEESEKETGEGSTGQNWGRQFSIEWISTTRLPFFRTRGLRNPWNANREVKIARDGTELEPTVAKRLLQMFHRPSPGPMPNNIPYR